MLRAVIELSKYILVINILLYTLTSFMVLRRDDRERRGICFRPPIPDDLDQPYDGQSCSAVIEKGFYIPFPAAFSSDRGVRLPGADARDIPEG